MRQSFKRVFLTGSAAFFLASTASAEPLPGNDIGILKNEEVQVVQHALYEKAGAFAVGFQLGAVGGDPYYHAISQGVHGSYFLSESLGLTLSIDNYLGMPSQEAERLSTYGGVTVDGFAPRLSATAGAEWAPIYGKFNLMGQGVVHYDTYLSGGLGLYLAQRTIFDGVELSETGNEDVWNRPLAVHLGLGHRFFFRALDLTQAVVVDMKDHIFAAEHPDGSLWAKHNIQFTLGWSLFL